MKTRIPLALVLLFAALTLVAACGDDDDDDDDDGGDDGGATATATGGGDGGDGVDITLQEFNVILGTDFAPAGEVTFNIENVGPDDVHEFVVIKTDLGAGSLPTVEDGSVDEEGEGVEVIDEVEDIPVGATETLTVNLEAGNYALICNIYDEDESESHYQEGMSTDFTVQ